MYLISFFNCNLVHFLSILLIVCLHTLLYTHHIIYNHHTGYIYTILYNNVAQLT